MQNLTATSDLSQAPVPEKKQLQFTFKIPLQTALLVAAGGIAVLMLIFAQLIQSVIKQSAQKTEFSEVSLPVNEELWLLEHPDALYQDPVLEPETTISNALTSTPVPLVAITPKKTQSNTRSYGLFFPSSNAITINNPTPTIIGKIPQTQNQYLATTFIYEKLEIKSDEMPLLRFLPGKVSSLTITIDDKAISSIFGIAQYPDIICSHEVEIILENGYTDRVQKAYPDKEACLNAKMSELPPLIFFAKPVQPLAAGEHVLTVKSGNASIGSMTFTVDQSYASSTQSLPLINADTIPTLFSSPDNCSIGYNYNGNHLKIPFSRFTNPFLFYGISFPQTNEEKGSIQRRRVQIGFDGVRFDLFFPASSLFYSREADQDGRLNPLKELYLPISHLYYSDGAKAAPKTLSTSPISDSGEYLELFPIDQGGYEYRGYSLPWQAWNSSGCDG